MTRNFQHLDGASFSLKLFGGIYSEFSLSATWGEGSERITRAIRMRALGGREETAIARAMQELGDWKASQHEKA